MTVIYKIFRSSEFAAFQHDGRSEGAPIDRTDGFIHLSTAQQVQETAAKHFHGQDELKLLGLETKLLVDALKWEPSRGGALFPHLYRALKTADVAWAKDLPLRDGLHDFTGLLS